jgi:hypothetical protein
MLAVATPFAQTRGAARGQTGPDPIFEHALDELGRIHTRGRARKAFNGEDARAAAAQLRTGAVYARQLNLDDRAKKTLRDQVGKKGRDALFDQPPDHTRGHAELKRHGIERDPRSAPTATPDYPTQSGELDDLLKAGPSAVLERTAAVLERLSAALDQQASNQPAGLRRVGQSWYSGFCTQLSAEIARLQVDATLVLLAAQFFPDLYGVYLMILGAIALQTSIYAWTCEWNWSL